MIVCLTIQSLNDVDGAVSTAYFKGSIEKATLKDLALLVFVDWSHVNSVSYTHLTLPTNREV